ncbi:MAG: hypothetical protein M1827_003697 [Pycnora praestabilis]|nr:MAG: hypothetical protein M1827_003697 [Pycnora praestabilis]
MQQFIPIINVLAAAGLISSAFAAPVSPAQGPGIASGEPIGPSGASGSLPSGHFIENTGDEDVIIFEVLQAPRYSECRYLNGPMAWPDASASREDYAQITVPHRTIANLPKVKQFIVQGDTSLTQTNLTQNASPEDQV